MNFNALRLKLEAKQKKTAVHPNLKPTVTTMPDGSTVITIPPVVGAEYLYESPVKDTPVLNPDGTPTGKTKKTGGNPMIYCLPASPDPKVNRVNFPITVVQDDGQKATLIFRMSGFSLFVNGIDESLPENEG